MQRLWSVQYSSIYIIINPNPTILIYLLGYLFIILLLLVSLFKNNKLYIYQVGENSLCNSILGYTKYVNDKNLCDLPCLKTPQYNIPNTTYGSCNNNVDVIFERIDNYITFNRNGYISFLNFNKRNGFVEKTVDISV